MKKLGLIIKREYSTRVQKRSFLLITVLVPLIIYLGFMGVRKFSANQANGFERLLVIDDNNVFFSHLDAIGNLKPVLIKSTPEKVKNSLRDQQNTFALYIPADFKDKQSVEIISSRNIGQSLLSSIQKQLQQQYLQQTLNQAGIKSNTLNVSVKEEISGQGNQTRDTKILGMIGFLAATLVYMSIFLYSNQVMRGVIEEKSSRIIEIVISSVKPFELMLGKVIGVGLVGISQFTLWVLTGYIGITFLGNDQLNLNTLPDIHLPYSIPVLTGLFLFYFTGGYFLYSALFAAVGSAVDNESESQQFVLPVTAPLILTIIMAQSVIVNDPSGRAAYWLSVIPFTSPVAMMVRLPLGVPVHEIIISVVLLLLCFAFVIWLAARIYRVGILTHGKESNFREMIKWMLIKN